MAASVGLVFRRGVGGWRKGRWEAGERPNFEGVVELVNEGRRRQSVRVEGQRDRAAERGLTPPVTMSGSLGWKSCGEIRTVSGLFDTKSVIVILLDSRAPSRPRHDRRRFRRREGRRERSLHRRSPSPAQDWMSQARRSQRCSTVGRSCLLRQRRGSARIGGGVSPSCDQVFVGARTYVRFRRMELESIDLLSDPMRMPEGVERDVSPSSGFGCRNGRETHTSVSLEHPQPACYRTPLVFIPL